MELEEKDKKEIKKLVEDSERELPPKPNRKVRRDKGLGPRIIKLGYIKSLTVQFTKSTNRIKKERAKNAKSKQERKRDVARARKARKESYSKVS